MKSRLMVCLGLASTMVLACGDTTGPVNGGNVTVNFAVAPTQSGALGVLAAAPADLPLDGNNGILNIEEIWLIADEFKLERLEGACEDAAESEESEDDNCEEFELPPFFLSVPLDGEGVGEISADVEPGTYEELKFETKAPDADSELLSDIRASYFDDWPEGASMVVVGTFTPTEGHAVAFRAYFDAEVKVELEFPDDEPLVVEEGGDPSVTVFVDPAVWFANDDGTVDDLSMYDFETTAEVFKFEAKFEDGFSKIELDDD